MISQRPSRRREGLFRFCAVGAGVVLALGGCKRDEPAAAPALLGEVKSALAAREKQLTSFRIEGVVREAGEEAPFLAAYRAPNRVRGELREPGRIFSFDGETLFDLDPAARTVVTYDVSGDRAGAAVALNQVLGAFVPEGYRVPLMDLSSATAKKVPHPRGPEAVELTSQTRDEKGETVDVVYVLRWPSMDLLEKRMTAYGTATVLSVDEEHCAAELKLCVPQRLTQTRGGAEGAVTQLSRIELNAAVPNDSFTLSPPEGFAARSGVFPAAP